MSPEERDNFDVLLASQVGLQREFAEMQELVTKVVLADLPPAAGPAPALKERVLNAAAAQRISSPDALVVADRDGGIEWINAAFTDMCGYTLAELKGRKPGAVLQGAETDPAAVARIRTAINERRPCRETLVNYHKDGSVYRADIRIAPILDESGEPLYFVARERVLEPVR